MEQDLMGKGQKPVDKKVNARMQNLLSEEMVKDVGVKNEEMPKDVIN
jgi:hypothetical protein